jgi:hypothetical protein
MVGTRRRWGAVFAGLGGFGSIWGVYLQVAGLRSVAGGTVKSRNRGGSGSLSAPRMVCYPLVIVERQVPPAPVSMTRMSSSASQHSWMWARMWSSR